VGIGVTPGALIRTMSAYFGGVADLLAQRTVHSLRAFPAIILALVVLLMPAAARGVRSQALAVAAYFQIERPKRQA
jgi:ABC-type dipeptide/oligopeptide/nickel transport system permease subunit